MRKTIYPNPNPDGSRMETGSVQFGEDWPGVFIRGDHALYLSTIIEFIKDKDLDPITRAGIENLAELLGSADANAFDAEAVKVSNRLTIPTIGSVLTLNEDWTFGLYPESRNEKFWNLITGSEYPLFKNGYVLCKAGAFIAVTLPAGTVLIVDRIYLRKGIQNYDSISLKIREHPIDKRFLKKRFWAKLDHFNTIMATWDEQTVPRSETPISTPDEIIIPSGDWDWCCFRKVPEDIYDLLRDNDETVFRMSVQRGLIQILRLTDGEIIFSEEGIKDADLQQG